MKILAALSFVLAIAVGAETALAAEFIYRESVTLRVGQSVILKGVRGRGCDGSAPSWGRISGSMPRSKLGTFSDGGRGTVDSDSCGEVVPARGVKFTAKKTGKETLTIYKDRVTITVK